MAVCGDQTKKLKFGIERFGKIRGDVVQSDPFIVD